MARAMFMSGWVLIRQRMESSYFLHTIAGLVAAVLECLLVIMVEDEVDLDRLSLQEDTDSEEDTPRIGLIAYAFEPLIARADLDSTSNSSESESESDQERADDSDSDPDPEHRVGSSHWCTCQNCVLMPTIKESVCCQELNAMEHKLHDEEYGDFCSITMNPRYVWIGWDSEALEVAMFGSAWIQRLCKLPCCPWQMSKLTSWKGSLVAGKLSSSFPFWFLF